MSKMIPATILTGFFDSGKATLLKYILSEQHGMGIAVIENKFGEESIDNDILMQDSDEQIVQMSNGYTCCTIRGDLVERLSGLLTHRGNGQIQFDRVVIETTGVIDPGPVVQTFFMDDEIASRYPPDTVVTLVDAKHSNMQLGRQEGVQRQVDFADVIFITKNDLVPVADVDALRHRLLHINLRAPIHTTNFGETPVDTIFDLRGFNLSAKPKINPSFLREDDHDHSHDHGHDRACSADCDRDHDHEHGHGHTPGHHRHHGRAYHTDHIALFVFRNERPFNYTKLERFLSGVLNIYGKKPPRYKGMLYMGGVDRKVVFQDVHQLINSDVGGKWDGETPSNRMVFIGVGLSRETILKELENCLV